MHAAPGVHTLPPSGQLGAGCSSHDTGRWHPRWQLCTLQQSLLQSMPEHRLLVPQGVGHTGRHYPRSTVPFLGKESTSIRRQKPTWDNFSLTRDIVIDRKLLFQERQMISTRAVQAISKWVLWGGVSGGGRPPGVQHGLCPPFLSFRTKVGEKGCRQSTFPLGFEPEHRGRHSRI